MHGCKGHNGKAPVWRGWVALTAALLAATLPWATARAADWDVGYEASLTASAGSGDFAPSYLMANNHGVLTQPATTTGRFLTSGITTNSHNFSFCFGVDVIGGYAKKTGYELYDAETATTTTRQAKNASLWIQQLYAEMAYRSIFASIGMKEEYSVIVNQELSSGDLCMSGNSRPMPGIMVGFVDFQDIPLTGGMLQINGEVGYYKTLDGSWMEDRYNYYNSFITTDYVLHYKYLHLRTAPHLPLSVTIGMQAACQIGGTASYYENGVLTETITTSLSLKDYFKAFIPSSGGSAEGDQVYYEGNHLGTWDLLVRYRLPSEDELMVYYQSLWEDGSSIGKQNGWDGLYGIEYSAAYEGPIEAVVVEYLDLTNQSGPIHWAPADYSGEGSTTITNEATGADDYYNNYSYNGYQYYGMSMGSPFVRSAIYNTDGYLRITDNRIRAFHIALQGHLAWNFQYRAKFGYRKSWGTPFIPLTATRSATSFMLEGIYYVPSIDGLSVKCQFGADFGELVGKNVGGLVTVTYSGIFGK